MMNITTGSLETHDCSSRLPFVCDDDGNPSATAAEDLICPKGWMVSLPLSTSERTCISQYEAQSFLAAEKNCGKHGGRLASLEEYLILHASDYRDSMRVGKYWLRKGKTAACKSKVMPFDNDYESNKTTVENCLQKNLFICVKHYGEERFKVNLSPSTFQSVTTEETGWADFISCDVETDEHLSDRQLFLYQWYKDDIPISSVSYILKLSYVGDALKRDPYIWNKATRQGNYHCEVKLLGSSKTYLSQKVKFSFSDISTFTIDISNITSGNKLDFSHGNFNKYMTDLDDAIMFNVVEKLKNHYAQAEWDFKSISLEKELTTLKIVVYIYRSDADIFDERMACEEIKEAIEEQQSIPTYLEDASFNVNCKDFADMTGYHQVVKTLKAVSLKLDNIEITQSEILEKLQHIENTRRINTPSGKGYFDTKTFLLQAAQELERLKHTLMNILPEDVRLEESSDERERNIFEYILPQLPTGRYWLGSSSSARVGFIDSHEPNLFERSRGMIPPEKNERYDYFSGEDSESDVSRPVYFKEEP